MAKLIGLKTGIIQRNGVLFGCNPEGSFFHCDEMTIKEYDEHKRQQEECKKWMVYEVKGIS